MTPVQSQHGGRVFGYARVSGDNQADNTSLPHQAECIRAWAKARGLSVDDVTKDVASGRTLERPGLNALRADLRSGDVVVVYKLDRLSRSVVDADPLITAWEQQGVSVFSVTEPLETGTAMGRAMYRMVLVFAQAEREVIQERVSAGRARNAREGGFNGSPVPFGYRLGGEGEPCLVPEPAEAECVHRLFTL
ncbi:MAG: recombinase family protein [Deltaproteobacteria bacterium]|nr:recombinase family protein [Deltaproteobacteria bacterium]